MRILKPLAVLLLLAILAAGGLFYFLNRPYAGFRSEVLLEIPKGASTRTISQMLAGAGVIENPWELMLARAIRPTAKLQAGEYRFAAPASPLAVYNRIARGDVYYRELTIPEGLNLFDIAAVVEETGLVTAKAFLEAARDPSLIRDLAPAAATLEGYLFPDTYRFTRHASARDFCRMFTHRFRAEWARLGSSDDVHRTVTLASLIEKEAAVPADRPLIASVFHNRLKRGMKLDCDPTTVYAALLEGRYRGKIHKSDLESPNPYNTYQHPGLPPGPIASPGDASLRAALHPAETSYLFFVARPDGSGSHEFSKDVAAHNTAALRYRRGVAK
ncbi:MAG TPA: endolytic transglycosylase MltG [Bryobacteraceae bacterium]|nr:endolytic transglycosylase MltG [Bryobacteraceae bacterium]